MEWLFYTVTYYSKEKQNKFNALHYSEWEDISGLIPPKSMSGYKTENDTVSVKRYDSEFSEIRISEQKLNDSLFSMPGEAEIDSLK
jgi:hypothetical protein